MPVRDHEATLQRLVDDAAVRALAARFSDAIGRCDRDAFSKLWTKNGIWTIGDPKSLTATGADQVMSLFDTLMSGWAFFVQLTHSGVVEFDGPDRANARWIIREFARSTDKSRSYDNFAMYEDTAVRSEGEWLFMRRNYHYVWLDDTPIAGRSFPLPRTLSSGQ